MKLANLTTALLLLFVIASVPAEAGKGGNGNGGCTPTGATGTSYFHAGGGMDGTAPTGVVPSAIAGAQDPKWTASNSVSFACQVISATFWAASAPSVGFGGPPIPKPTVHQVYWQVTVEQQTSGTWQPVAMGWSFPSGTTVDAGSKHSVVLSQISSPGTGPLRVSVQPFTQGLIAPGVVLYDAVLYPSCIVIGTGTC